MTKPTLEELAERAGHAIVCVNCGGAGLVSVWSFGVKEPDECGYCGGSGQNWQYPNGTIARHYAGPLLGRALAQKDHPHA